MLLTARQAADRLGIKLDSLYAYVSRGRLRSVVVPGTRERRYRSEITTDVRSTRADAGDRLFYLSDRRWALLLPRAGRRSPLRHRDPRGDREAAVARPSWRRAHR